MGSNGDDRDNASGVHKEGEERSDICRDYMKNICNRGSRCKFYHPPDLHHEGGNDEVKFCIDFQNRGCARENCRYVHAHRDDAERYKRSGEVTMSLARAIAAITGSDTVNGIPFCKEFLTGTCSRGSTRCRYWHINPDEERDRRRRMTERGASAANAVPPLSGPPMPPPFRPFTPIPPQPQRRPMPPDFDPYEAKRARFDEHMMMTSSPASQRYMQDLERRNVELTKENEGLRRELTRERERYEDLYALFRQQSVAQVSVAPNASAAFSHGGPMPAGGNMHQSRAPTMGIPDVAVHWSVAGAPHWST